MTLCAAKFQHAPKRLVLALERLQDFAAPRPHAAPAPAKHHASEKIVFNAERVEARHVAVRIPPLEVKLVS